MNKEVCYCGMLEDEHKFETHEFKAMEQPLYAIFGGEPPKEYPNTSIKLKYCGLCGGFYVECPKCGNNSCNGTYGTMPDGKHCDICEIMYDIMYKLNGSEHSVVNKTNLGDKINDILQKDYPKNDSMANMRTFQPPQCICPDNCTDEGCPVCIPEGDTRFIGLDHPGVFIKEYD